MAGKNNSSKLNAVAFYSIIIAAIVYLLNLVLTKIGVNFFLLPILQNTAEAVIIILGMILGWRYASKRNIAIKIAYLVSFLVILACIVIPLLPI